jgi:hypothetical protein
MHSQYMVINELPRSVSAITAAFKSQYIEKYGICPPENSYIFSLTVVLVGKQTKKVPGVRLETADNANSKSSEAKRIETTAGSIWKPAGWSLQREANAYVLRAETTR